jgi:hypothetical protein
MTMNTTRTLALSLAVLLVVAPVAAAVPTVGTTVAAAATPTATTTTTAADGGSVSPGEKLSGVVSVQGAELEGEVAERTYGVKVARANSSGAKAAVVAATVDDVEARVDELEARKRVLEQRRANGTVTEGEYRAKMARVAAELSTARRLANASGETAAGLPEDALAKRGVDVTAIENLRHRAGNLTGPEVASVARSIAGASVGRSMSGTQKPADVGEKGPRGPPNGTDGGPPDDRDGRPNGTDAGPPDDRDGASTGTDAGAPNGTDESG